MNILITGINGYIGALLAPRLQRDGHELRGLSRRPRRLASGIPVLEGDALTGAGLEAALEGVQVAYFLIHSMEAAQDGSFAARDRLAAENFARTAQAAGVERIVYLGGLVPPGGPVSPHLVSRLQVEETLLRATADSVALRASIVIGAGSRPFRFLVRLVERLPVVPVPAWRSHRTTPVDERDMIEILAQAATSERLGGRSVDVAGPEEITYGDFIAKIRDHLLLGRPTIGFKRLTVTPIASRIASVIAGEEHELIGPLMESLGTDLLAGDTRADQLLALRLHSLDAAIERALREWEATEPLAAR